MNRWNFWNFVVVLTLLVGVNLSRAEDAAAVTPPEGFTALFNGKDLSGWWGLGTEDPAKWMALPPEKLAEKKAASLLDIQKHWRVENGELVNDGQGLYLSTEKNYDDFEFLVEYKTVAKADSGVYLKGYPQVRNPACAKRPGQALEFNPRPPGSEVL